MKESSKQCRQSHFPEMGEPVKVTDLISSKKEGRVLLYADHLGLCLDGLGMTLTDNLQEIIMLVGPEGGFSADEMSALKCSDAIPVRLGEFILRTEAAAISFLSAVNQVSHSDRL